MDVLLFGASTLVLVERPQNAILVCLAHSLQDHLVYQVYPRRLALHLNGRFCQLCLQLVQLLLLSAGMRFVIVVLNVRVEESSFQFRIVVLPHCFAEAGLGKLDARVNLVGLVQIVAQEVDVLKRKRLNERDGGRVYDVSQPAVFLL